MSLSLLLCRYLPFPSLAPLVFVEVEVSGDCLVVAVAHSVLTILLSLEYWNLQDYKY